MNYDPRIENARIEFEASYNIRKLFGVSTTEEISDLSQRGVKNAKNRVLNIAEALGVPEAIIEEEDSYKHSLVLPSEDCNTRPSIAVEPVVMRDEKLFKIRPSLLFLNQIYRGLEMAQGQIADFETDEDYTRLKTETIGYVYRFGVAKRIIGSMQEKMPGNKSIFRDVDTNIGFSSFAGYISLKHLMVDAFGTLSPDGIYDIQDEFSASVRAATKSLISRDASRARLLEDSATFGVVRPMTDSEASETLEVFYDNSRPYCVVA